MVLVTGANGYLGKRLVSRLKAEGHEVVGLIRADQVNVDATEWGIDLANPLHIAQLRCLERFPEVVIHLSGRVEIRLKPSPSGPSHPPVSDTESISRIYADNVLGTANILELCLHHKVRHLIFASSQTVYGFPVSETLFETSPCKPIEHYAISKLCAELMLEAATYQGIAITALRIPGLFSEDRTKGVVYEFCRSALDRNEVEVSAQFPLPIDVIHLEDVIQALIQTIDVGGTGWRVVNISTGEPCSLDLLAKEVAALAGDCTVVDSSVPQPVIRMDAGRAKQLLDWTAFPRRARILQMIDRLKRSKMRHEDRS